MVSPEDARRIAAQVRNDVEHTPGISERIPAIGARIETFAAMLALWGSKSNLTARPRDPVEIAFHVMDSLMPLVLALGDDPGPFAGAFDSGQRIRDIGSGAGFPGLILAAACEADFTLMESRRKRASFLSFAIAEMGLVNARVEQSRAPDMRKEYDLVVERAVGGSDFFALAHAVLKPGGLALRYVSEAQMLEPEDAAAVGFGDCVQSKYSLIHNDRTVNRVLATWRKS